MNGKILLEFEEQHPELQDEFLKGIGMQNSPEMIQIRRLDSSDYWDFVLGEMNGRI